MQNLTNTLIAQILLKIAVLKQMLTRVIIYGMIKVSTLLKDITKPIS